MGSRLGGEAAASTGCTARCGGCCCLTGDGGRICCTKQPAGTSWTAAGWNMAEGPVGEWDSNARTRTLTLTQHEFLVLL